MITEVDVGDFLALFGCKKVTRKLFSGSRLSNLFPYMAIVWGLNYFPDFMTKSDIFAEIYMNFKMYAVAFF